MAELTRVENFKRIKDVQDKEFLRSEWGLTEDDVDFLIEEVERLRKTLESIRDYHPHCHQGALAELTLEVKS